jgi:GH43 family beta-xylosidase
MRNQSIEILQPCAHVHWKVGARWHDHNRPVTSSSEKFYSWCGVLMRNFILLSLALLAPWSALFAFPVPTAMTDPSASGDTFTNPLLPEGADPSVEQSGEFYYYMQTTGINLTLWRTRDITDLRNAESKVIWTPPKTGPYAKEIWAPEVHFLQGRWYIYFAADGGMNESHRLYVLENKNLDPMQGEWDLKGKLADETDRWAIDPSVFEVAGKDYLIWSGWQEEENVVQNIYIALLKNPWTIAGPRVLLSSPQYPWEKVGDLDNGDRGTIQTPHVDVNEGPEMLQHGDKLFLVYSASGCWTNYYELGMLSASSSSNLLDPASWTKSKTAVFYESPEAGVFGPGHNTFFKSPDGKEDWILYHANAGPGLGCGSKRSPRAQKFTWHPDGSPDFGRPLATSQRLKKPSGTK